MKSYFVQKKAIGFVNLWFILVAAIGLTLVSALSLDLKYKSFLIVLSIVALIATLCYLILRKFVPLFLSIASARSAERVVEMERRHDAQIGVPLLVFFILWSGYMGAMSFLDIDSYRALIAEDGIVENASALAWTTAALLMAIKTITLVRGGKGLEITVSLLLTAFFIVCCGEEISWGQRIFELKTPELLREINVQNEITLHNIGSISVFSNLFFLIAVTFFLVIPYLFRHHLMLRNVLSQLRLPVPSRFASYTFMIGLFVWIVIGLRFGTLGFHPFSFYPENYYNQMDDEAFELFAAYAFLAFSALNLTAVYIEKK